MILEILCHWLKLHLYLKLWRVEIMILDQFLVLNIFLNAIRSLDNMWLGCCGIRIRAVGWGELANPNISNQQTGLTHRSSRPAHFTAGLGFGSVAGIPGGLGEGDGGVQGHPPAG